VGHEPVTGDRERNLRLTLAYDGTGFVGWQRQAQGASIQGLLEDALSRIEGRPVTVIGAGRTDAGVHALGQVAGVRLGHAIDVRTLARALNAVLPPAVRILRVDEVPPGFHARFSALGKTYHYAVANVEVVSPFASRYVWHVPQRLDTARMAAAAEVLAGRHDFSAFQSSGAAVRTSVRTIEVSAFRRAGPGEPAWVPPGLPGQPGALFIYEVVAEGFLRQMVRAMVGTLVEVGLGRLEAGEMAAILAAGDRRRAGPTAPAAGLCLVAVRYDHEGGESTAGDLATVGGSL
jgi:tRNA pseudouridine38-40 synthase